jgi:hypothetical protein
MTRKPAVKEKRPPAPRGMINIELSPEAQQAVDQACDQTGMKKRELVARVLRWFTSQDEEVRALVLGSIPKSIVPMVTRHLLEKLSGTDELVAHIPEKSEKESV